MDGHEAGATTTSSSRRKNTAPLVVSVSELWGLEANCSVEVMGVMHWVGAVALNESPNGGLVHMRTIQVADSSWPAPVLVALWGWAACRSVRRLRRGQVVRVLGRSSDYGGASINAREGVRAVVDGSLRRWYRRPGTPRGLDRVMTLVRGAEVKACGSRLHSKGCPPSILARGDWLPAWHPLVMARYDPSRRVVDSMNLSRKSKKRMDGVAQLMSRRYARCGALHVSSATFRPESPGSAVKAVQRICEQIVPKEMWGSRYNVKAARRVVDETLRGSAVPTARARKLVCRFRLAETKAKTRVAFEAWLEWFISELVVPACRAFFFVTTDGQFRLATDWRTLEARFCRGAPFLRELGSSEPRREANARARLAPKPHGGARLVQSCVKTRRQRDAFLVLRFETRRDPTLVGFGGASGQDRLWRALRGLKREAATTSSSSGNCWKVAKVDVEHCYDRIEQRRVFELATSALRSTSYLVFSGSKKRARAVEANAETRGKRGRIVSRDEVVSALRSVILEHIVRLGSLYFRQIAGLPQGSILSPLLCDIYYGQLEKELPKPALAIRIVDDLLVADSLRFPLEAVLDAYAPAANATKSIANFAHPAMNAIAPTDTNIHFCGLNIACESLQVTYARSPRPGGRDLDRLFAACLHGIYFDPLINTKRTLHKNLRATFQSAADRISPKILYSTEVTRLAFRIHNAVRFAFALYRRSRRRFNLPIETDNALRLRDFYQAAYHVFKPYLRPRSEAGRRALSSRGTRKRRRKRVASSGGRQSMT